jgi:hypothetical protein
MTTVHDSSVTLEHRIGPRGRLTLSQPAGEVTIKGVEGDTVCVRSRDDRPLTDLFRVETSSDSLELRPIDHFGIAMLRPNREDAPDLAIEVPHGATLRIETASADVEAADLSGMKEFKTASGDLALTRIAGPANVESVSGDVTIEGQAPLDLAIRSISGDIRIRAPLLRRLELSTTSGDSRLDAELTGAGPFVIRSVSGDVTIVARAGMRVEAATIMGDLSSSLSHRTESVPGRKVLVIGKPGPTLAFHSVSGDLRVVEPRDAAAESAAAAPAGGAPDAGDGPAPADKPAAPPISEADAEAERLRILQELERGEITVAGATDQLARLDEVLR